MQFRTFAVPALALAGALACTSETIVREAAPNEPLALPLGAICATDAHCGPSLSCQLMSLNGECTDTRSCTRACTQDAECAALDPRGKCIDGCDGAKICALVEETVVAPTTDLPLGAACETRENCNGLLTCRHHRATAATCSKDAICTRVCEGHAECRDIHPSAKCVEGCDGERICMRTSDE